MLGKKNLQEGISKAGLCDVGNRSASRGIYCKPVRLTKRASATRKHVREGQEPAKLPWCNGRMSIIALCICDRLLKDANVYMSWSPTNYSRGKSTASENHVVTGKERTEGRYNHGRTNEISTFRAEDWVGEAADVQCSVSSQAWRPLMLGKVALRPRWRNNKRLMKRSFLAWHVGE